MKLKDVITKQKAKFRRMWLVNTTGKALLAEVFFNEEEQWKNMTIAPFVIKEYEQEEVIQFHTHPYYSDTVMIYVHYSKNLQDTAYEKCLAAINNEEERKRIENVQRDKS